MDVEEDDAGYSSDDSLEYCITKAFLYPKMMTREEIKILTWPVYNHIRQHKDQNGCGCPYQNWR
jgi:hypothetical protein